MSDNGGGNTSSQTDTTSSTDSSSDISIPIYESSHGNVDYKVEGLVS